MDMYPSRYQWDRKPVCIWIKNNLAERTINYSWRCQVHSQKDERRKLQSYGFLWGTAISLRDGRPRARAGLSKYISGLCRKIFRTVSQNSELKVDSSSLCFSYLVFWEGVSQRVLGMIWWGCNEVDFTYVRKTIQCASAVATAKTKILLLRQLSQDLEERVGFLELGPVLLGPAACDLRLKSMPWSLILHSYFCQLEFLFLWKEQSF